MRPGSFWWDWLPEVLTGLKMTICRAHGHAPFFLLYKEDPFIVGRPPQPDSRYSLTWDVLLETGGALAE